MTTTQPAALPERFTKKPVTIEAVQFKNDGSSYALIRWINEGQHAAGRRFATWRNDEIIVPTLEGEHIASVGDWIIKGIKGEFYPCKPDIFELTYDRAALQSAQPAEVSDAKWEGAEEWMPLAWELCADEHGEGACNELIWTGGPIPEPWGDRWLQYEDEAKRLITLVRKHVPALRPQAVPMSHHDVVVMQFKLGQKFNDMTIGDLQTVVTAVEAHHGITAQGAQGGEG